MVCQLETTLSTLSTVSNVLHQHRCKRCCQYGGLFETLQWCQLVSVHLSKITQKISLLNLPEI